MDREDIIKLALEARFSFNGASYPAIERFAKLIAAAEREKVAAWMITKGYATGHGDTIEDLLKELEWQIEDRVKNIIRATGGS